MASADLRLGDCRELLKDIPNESVDCCITSPSYYGLRDYGTAQWEGGNEQCEHRNIDSVQSGTAEGHNTDQPARKSTLKPYKNICGKCGAVRIDKQIGLEETPAEYITELVKVFIEIKRILKTDGTMWVNIADSYAGNSTGSLTNTSKLQGGKKTQEVAFNRPDKMAPGLKSKDLIGIPWMLAFALRDDGWYLRQEIIWAKPGPMPESVTDRCTKSHESIFLLAKSAMYYYDADAIKEPSKYPNDNRKERSAKEQKRFPTDKVAGVRDGSATYENRNKRDVWTVNTAGYKDCHFATFPEKLITPCILTTRKDAVIIDPFMGAGTTGVVAIKNGRSFIGCELNAEYLELAKERIRIAGLQGRLL